jgi:hypothetical protein
MITWMVCSAKPYVPLPPFGLVTICFLGLASYLLLVGIHSSALSVANDIELRRSIKESVRHESNLLGNIGSAQMESVLQNRVMKVVRNLSGEIEEETGVESSLEENELKDYVQMAIQEMRSKKK